MGDSTAITVGRAGSGVVCPPGQPDGGPGRPPWHPWRARRARRPPHYTHRMAPRRPLPTNAIRVVGAREHNLRDVSVDIPRDDLVVITGLSGSGKSSLAFDTLYAEGQRRYVESLSAYARQFLGQMDKPDIDHIEGLSPAISIDQKTTSRNPRSTVATVTEIYDYLRLLYARVGEPHCPICGRPITGQTVEQIADHVLALPEGTRFMVLAPLVRGRKGEHRDVLESIRAEGFSRVMVDGTVHTGRRAPGARQEVQPHDRGGGRPAGDARRPAPPPDRQPRDRDGPRRRPRAHRGGAPRRRDRRSRGPTPSVSPARSTARRCPSSPRAPSRSTPPTAPAPPAPASASAPRSTPSS